MTNPWALSDTGWLQLRAVVYCSSIIIAGRSYSWISRSFQVNYATLFTFTEQMTMDVDVCSQVLVSILCASECRFTASLRVRGSMCALFKGQVFFGRVKSVRAVWKYRFNWLIYSASIKFFWSCAFVFVLALVVRLQRVHPLVLPRERQEARSLLRLFHWSPSLQ